MTRTFWLLVLYGARRLCPLLVHCPVPLIISPIANDSERECDATYVGESGVRHCDGFPGDSVGDCLLQIVSVRRGGRRLCAVV
jgi:hypothetical protein